MRRMNTLFTAALVATVATLSRADSLSSSATYFNIHRDPRLCASPVCGGFIVARVNSAKTRCADGSHQPACYTAEVNWSRLHLSPEELAAVQRAADAGQVLLRGRIKLRDFKTAGALGVFVATEAWLSAGSATPSGDFYRLSDNGINCVTLPCFSLHESRLNSREAIEISGLDLSAVGADPPQLAAAEAALHGDTLLVSGWNQFPPGAFSQTASTTLVASQFWLRARPGPPPLPLAGPAADRE